MLQFNGKEANELIMNGRRAVKAYYASAEIWHRKNKVTFLNGDNTVCGVKYVETGENAFPPSAPLFSRFYDGKTYWPDIPKIQCDTVVTPISDINKAYIFKSGSNVNTDLTASFSSVAMTIYDGDLSSNYGDVSKLSISSKNISGSVIGSTNSSLTKYRVAKYVCSNAINVSTLKDKGFTTLKFNGSYNLPAVSLYGNSLRDVFFAITTGTKITVTSSGISGTNLKKVEKYSYKSVGSTLTSGSAITNTNWTGSITLPTSGNYYITAGVLTKYVRGDSNSSTTTGSVTINNIWLE